MIRTSLSLLALLIICVSANGQLLKPVEWNFSTRHLEGNRYELIFSAEIDPGWAVYSQNIPEDQGPAPVPTSFNFTEGAHYSLVGDILEPESGQTKYDPVFEMELTKFFGTADFIQIVEISDDSKPVTGYLTFMTCDDERCLPPTDEDFSFVAGKSTTAQVDEGGATTEEEEFSIPDVSIDFPDVEGVTAEDQPGMYNPVSWTTGYRRLGGDSVVLQVQAEIDEGWYVYTQHIDEDAVGPVPTTFYFTEQEEVQLVGDVQESGPKRLKGHDKYFDMELIKYKESVLFEQVAVVNAGVEEVSGSLEFMTCNDEHCLPGDFVDFTIDLTASGVLQTVVQSPDELPAEGTVIDQTIPTVQATYKDPVGDCLEEEESEEDSSLLWTFILGFLGGLVALLTPCVFPMIPLTVSYFSKDTRRSGVSNGLIYGASIIVIYVALGLLITGLFGATALNELSTNWIANSIFFAIFVLFAFSFFGYYEIQLPSSWANRSDQLADKGGLLGIFFMAFTLALVSFSCTGPIIGSAIVQSATSTQGPLVVMLGFSTALALPFGLFAAFPAWLNSLPRSGSWMNSVKVVLGFLELALAFKFLSVADMTSHWGFLRYELFLGIWALVAIGLALYLFGLIRFPHDSPLRRLSLPRATLGVGFSVLALYLMTGFLPSERTGTYNALPLLSGLAPPAHYNFWMPVSEPDPAIKARFPSYSKCANNLSCFHDYYEGMEYAAEVGKPVFLDFTGYGCVNCRKMEEHVWIKDKVWPRLKNDFVMISLYVDDREALDSIMYSAVQQKTLRNVGNMWSDFQIANFGQNSQPLYVIMSPDGQVLTPTRTYQRDVQGYADFLECGLQTFNQLSQRIGERKE